MTPMYLFSVFAGDREWERVFGEWLCGTVLAKDENEAIEKAKAGNWIFEGKGHPPAGAGYWPILELWR